MPKTPAKSRKSESKVTYIFLERGIASRLKQLRGVDQCTQYQLSQTAKLSRKTINLAESGLKNSISLRTLVQLAGALGVTPNDLLGIGVGGFSSGSAGGSGKRQQTKKQRRLG